MRGQTGIAQPYAVGEAVVALAWCNDRDRLVAATASSTDGGATWSTARLTDLAPDGRDDVSVPRAYESAFAVPVGDTVVLLVQGAPSVPDEADYSVIDEAGPLVAVVVEAA